MVMYDGTVETRFGIKKYFGCQSFSRTAPDPEKEEGPSSSRLQAVDTEANYY